MNYKSSKLNLNISCKGIVISSMKSPSALPNHPPILSINAIQKMTSIIQLKELEQRYDDFLDKNIQVLLLYNVIEDYLELRDALTIRISRLRRESYLRFHLNKYILEE